jgi:hypothetical protein
MSPTNLIVIGVVVFGVYFVGSYVSAGADHKTFTKQVRDIVDYNWGRDDAKESIERMIRDEAQKRGIALGPDDVVVKYSKTVIGESKYTIQYYVLVTATVTYARKITPLYTKRLTINATNRMGKG